MFFKFSSVQPPLFVNLAYHLRTWLYKRRWQKLVNTITDDSGLWGEELAVLFLKQKKYRILGQRIRPNRRDELDIVARKENILVFIEVKTRASEQYGAPVAAVNRHKRHTLNRAAAAYMRRLGNPKVIFRFDVIEVVGSPGHEPHIRHIENAFPFESRRLITG